MRPLLMDLYMPVTWLMDLPELLLKVCCTKDPDCSHFTLNIRLIMKIDEVWHQKISILT